MQAELTGGAVAAAVTTDPKHWLLQRQDHPAFTRIRNRWDCFSHTNCLPVPTTLPRGEEQPEAETLPCFERMTAMRLPDDRWPTEN